MHLSVNLFYIGIAFQTTPSSSLFFVHNVLSAVCVIKWSNWCLFCPHICHSTIILRVKHLSAEFNRLNIHDMKPSVSPVATSSQSILDHSREWHSAQLRTNYQSNRIDDALKWSSIVCKSQRIIVYHNFTLFNTTLTTYR